MKKNFEYYLENNRARSLVREVMEVRPLFAAAKRAAAVGPVDEALHIACGVGSSTSQLVKYFAPRKIKAVERESELVEIARLSHDPERFEFSVADVFSLAFPDESFDVVFNLADLHNYAEWRRGLSEIRRVLKHGGHLIMEDMSMESFKHGAGRLFRRLTDHPYDEMLTVDEFKTQASSIGFEILLVQEMNAIGLLKYFIMIARKI
jgi:ubiquinone/menaquinone biosynthesis C-methylase UbiE